MNYQEIAKNMIDRLPDDKMIFVINMLEGLGEMSGLDIYPDFKPNATTIAALPETLKNRDSFTAHTYPVCPVYSSHKYSRPADHRLARRIPPEYPWDFPRKDWYSFYPCHNNRPDISIHFLWE